MDYKDELMHNGVLGMKWGHRKQKQTSKTLNKVNSTKAKYKSAKKAYSKSFGKAYRNSNIHPITQFATKKGKEKSDALWNQSYDDMKRVNSAKSAYKSAKKAYKTDEKAQKGFEKNAKKLRKGSIYAVVGMAYASTGMKRLAKKSFDKSDKQYATWQSNAKSYLSSIKGKSVSTLDVYDEMDRRRI